MIGVRLIALAALEASSGMQIRLLGLLEAELDGDPLVLGAAKQRAVLAMLALRANAPVSTDRLIEGLWGEEPPQSAPKMVQHYVSQLRKLLAGEGAEILTRGRGYELRLPADCVDALRFERLVVTAGRDGRRANGSAREALSLWRGPPLDDLADEPFAAPEIRRLDELWLRARELAIDDALAEGEHRQLVGELDDLVARHPLRERLHVQRMVALYRCGRQAEALEAYRQARELLVDEIAVEPGPELRRLHDAILQQDPSLDAPSEEHGAAGEQVASATRYRLLGPVVALVDGQAADLGGPRQRGVLVVLLTQAGTVVPVSRAIDAIWGDEPPTSAVNLLQRSVSQLRKVLGRDAIETRGAGYLIRVEPDALDLHVFERLARAGTAALYDRQYEQAAGLLREALALWSGPALADLADQPFLEHEAARLEEMRLLALERALEADIARGRHADALVEAEALVQAHPLRERPRELIMRALYGSGRQADALEAYRRARATFIEELGIEPSPALRELEQAILQQDEALAPRDATAPARPGGGADRLRTLLVAPLAATPPDGLMSLAEGLARQPRREVVLAETVADGRELAAASRRLHELREGLSGNGLEVRAAAFTSVTPGADLARLATEQDADLLLTDAPEQLLEDGRLVTLLESAPCDVGVLVGKGELRGPVLVPFAGAAHDWSAVEIGAWLARNSGGTLRLAGASTSAEGRDASRLLANASLAVQHALGVPADPLLVDPEPEALVAAAAGAALVVTGLTERWKREGLGRTRTALATAGTVPVLLVRRGVRPGGLAPRDSDTRFTWTLAGT
jgi:DNA-binding SARP family transcriptional activator